MCSMFLTDLFLICVSQKLGYMKLFHVFFLVKIYKSGRLEGYSKITFLSYF